MEFKFHNRDMCIRYRLEVSHFLCLRQYVMQYNKEVLLQKRYYVRNST
jgi:hypothetical protein